MDNVITPRKRIYNMLLVMAKSNNPYDNIPDEQYAGMIAEGITQSIEDWLDDLIAAHIRGMAREILRHYETVNKNDRRGQS